MVFPRKPGGLIVGGFLIALTALLWLFLKPGSAASIEAPPTATATPLSWIRLDIADAQTEPFMTVSRAILAPTPSAVSTMTPALLQTAATVAVQPTPAPPTPIPQTFTPEAPPAPLLTGWPVAGEISQSFGCSDYYSGIPAPGCPADAPWFHDGLDVAAPVGTPVQATLTGTVIFAGPDGDGPLCNRSYRGYGLGVVVDNGQGWQALYTHLSEVYVQAGQTVTPETVIGLVGETGCATGPHLHFGLRHRETLVDPLAIKGDEGVYPI
jgi:murein DD-endopeptidase MepM/ murein hydrolase activator NlpD